ncbi:MAG: HIT domain-containing protein [Plesiomonas sp.]|uniref:HIT domain-containing protein n=1 Tax=Plesiomonas sp. TaxID=2486279 RepID=UPI003F3C3A3D
MLPHSDFVLHPQLLADTTTLGFFPLCQVLLSKDSNVPWLILVPQRNNIKEIHQLTDAEQIQLMQESSSLARIIEQIYTPDKLNIAAIGNIVSQLHIHHVARFQQDAVWPAPIWGHLASKLRSVHEQTQASLLLLEKLKQLANFVPAD